MFPLINRRHVDACIKDAHTTSVQMENEKLVIGILTSFHNNKKMKTLSDTTELVEHAITSTVIEENSAILQNILKWNQVFITTIRFLQYQVRGLMQSEASRPATSKPH